MFIRLVANKCNIRNWNYTQLGEMSYEDASVHLQGMEMVGEVPCWSKEDNRFAYDNDGLSIVPEVINCILRQCKFNDETKYLTIFYSGILCVTVRFFVQPFRWH